MATGIARPTFGAQEFALLSHYPQMASCPMCDGFSERFNIPTLREYQDFVRQLIEIVSQGTLLLVHADCPLQDMLNGPFPRDSSSHDFQCFACGRTFHLSADTYHGHATWTVGDLATEGLSKPN